MRLTARQRDCLDMTEAGMKQEAIAEVLGISQPAVCKHLAAARAKLGEADSQHDLTGRQQDCWDMAQAGMRQVDIAEALGIRQKVVSCHIEAARRKLGVETGPRAEPRRPRRRAQSEPMMMSLDDVDESKIVAVV